MDQREVVDQLDGGRRRERRSVVAVYRFADQKAESGAKALASRGRRIEATEA